MNKTPMPEGGFWMVTEEIKFEELDFQDDENYTDEDFYPDSDF